MIFWKELGYYTDSSLGMISAQIKQQQIRERQFLITRYTFGGFKIVNFLDKNLSNANTDKS